MSVCLQLSMYILKALAVVESEPGWTITESVGQKPSKAGEKEKGGYAIDAME